MKIVQPLLVLVLLAGPVRLQASNPKVDSLLRVLQTHATADRAEVLWGIAYELFDIDNGQAVFYAERAYHEVWAKGDSLQIVKVGTTYGQLLRRQPADRQGGYDVRAIASKGGEGGPVD